MPKRAILRLAISAAEILLANGAEIFRVEETIQHILDAFAIRDYSLYVLSNGIFVVLDGEDSENFAELRHVPATAMHLGRIAAVNELSREIARNPDPDRIEEYRSRLAQCAEVPQFPLWLRMICSGIGSGCFCYLFGGRLFDCVAAFLCGVVLHLFLSAYGKRKRSRFVHTLMGAAIVTTLAAVIAGIFPLSLDHIIIGAIISLVPGVALTTAIRDFFNGDFLSGTIHLTEALLSGICIAVGVGVALQFWQFARGGILL